MSGLDTLPAAVRVYAAPGIFIDRVDSAIAIAGFMELFGPEASTARALKVQESINST
jgi:hypothetical protein